MDMFAQRQPGFISWGSFMAVAKQRFKFRFRQSNFPKINRKNMNEFIFTNVIGQGSYSTTFLVKSKQWQCTHAVKVIEKKKIMAENKLKSVLNEVLIMDSIEFPFVTNLKFLMKDNANIYIGMELAYGGDLSRYVDRMFRKNVEALLFYSAQVVMALEYLHSLGIVHRDVKLSNLLLDSRGYIQLTDFEVAKKIDDGRTYTRCGTTEYMAPEQYFGIAGYELMVDWWAFGILMLKMIAGDIPIGKTDGGMNAFYASIANGITYPEDTTESCRPLINDLLRIRQDDRLGRMGAQEVKEHEFFRAMDWERLFQRCYIPVLVPQRFFSDCNGQISNSFQLSKSSTLSYSEVDQFAEEFKDF